MIFMITIVPGWLMKIVESCKYGTVTSGRPGRNYAGAGVEIYFRNTYIKGHSQIIMMKQRAEMMIRCVV